MGQTTDLLVIILILLIVAVVLDGLRRKWRGRGDRVVMKLDKSFLRGNVDAPEDALSNSELPNGGARTLTRDGEVPISRKPAPKLKLKNGLQGGADATAAAAGSEKSGHDAVPVLMDAVELEETTIEHANVFVSAQAPQQFAPELFEDEASSGEVRSNAVEGNEMLDVQLEELEKLGRSGIAPSAGRDPAYDDEDEDEDDFDEDDEDFDDEDEDEDDWDDEDEEDDDDYEDDDEEDDDEEEGYPRRRQDDEDDEEEDDWDDEWDEDDDEDDDEDEDDEDDEDEDDWDDEEEGEQYSGDYESEPTLLEETYARAASHFSRPPPAPEVRIEPGFGDAEEPPADLPDEEVLLEDFDESFLQDEPLFAEPVSGLEPAPETARIEASPEERKAREYGKDKAERLAFFSKSLLGRQQQKELFDEEPQAAAEPLDAGDEVSEVEGPTEVLIINVMARHGYHFFGEDLLPVLRQQGMQLGEMSIFHRHESADGNGRVVFSMANMVKPGTFDLAAMDGFSTPGLSFFLQLPNKYGNMESFELMLATATALRDGLEGELKDENRSVFTRQTIEHSRQRIRDFELSLLSRK
ncbi:MAG TPA: cell division protein ZipA [Hyphomicrobiales bacterium]|nr:cell division protein ZipA [Hyphomicrobiales bacterium]